MALRSGYFLVVLNNCIIIVTLGFGRQNVVILKYSRISVVRTLMNWLPRLFQLVLGSLEKSHRGRFGMAYDDFLYCTKMVCCVYSLESPRRGNSIENTQHTSIRNIDTISRLCILTWRHD